MADTSKTPTHTAFALKRTTRRHGHWLEIGKARMDPDGGAHVFLDRLPVGGFNGYVYLSPAGTPPPAVDAEPQRPARFGEDDEDGAA
jgi:hypothetical protein